MKAHKNAVSTRYPVLSTLSLDYQTANLLGIQSILRTLSSSGTDPVNVPIRLLSIGKGETKLSTRFVIITASFVFTTKLSRKRMLTLSAAKQCKAYSLMITAI
jgi:hypothetical protein